MFFRYRSEKESKRLDEAGVTRNVVDSAVAEFLLEIMAKHGKPAERLCNKDMFDCLNVTDSSLVSHDFR